jgi:long-chain acyl-CoA synthetase
VHTINNPLLRAERTAADAEGLICGDVRLTFGEFVSRCRRLGTVLSDLGTVRNDRIAIVAFNSIPLMELYCGIPAAGRVQVPLNFRWAHPELVYAIEDSGARVLFIDRDPGPLADLVETVVRLDTADYEARLAAVQETDFDAGIRADDMAGLFYTGGTTGASKGVMLTHANLIANAYNSQMFWPLGPGDVYQVIAPLFHAAGSTSALQCIYQGVPQVLVPAFDPGAILDQIEAEHVTATLGVPSMLAAQVEAQLDSPRDMSSLRIYGHGGSPVPIEVIRRATQAFPTTEFAHVYGATETAPLLTGVRHEELNLDEERSRSCGQPLIGVEVEIRRPDGTPSPIGEPGEVTVHGDNIMAGYWNKPEQTATVLRGGWYSTGDVGRVDHQGYLYLLDRSKDMIISGGENVYSTEVEDAIYTHPGVLEAAVFGIPDESWGEAVHAVVVLRAGVEVTPEDIMAHARESIAGYKVPRSVQLRAEELPKSGPGKVLKRELRAPFWTDHQTQIN